MPVVWSLLLALPASWGLGLAGAMLIDRSSSMLPAMTILAVLAILVLLSVSPWAAPTVRLRLMQGLAVFSVLLMIGLA